MQRGGERGAGRQAGELGDGFAAATPRSTAEILEELRGIEAAGRVGVFGEGEQGGGGVRVE